MENEQLLKIILERFDKVDQRFDKVDQQFEKVDQQFKEVDLQFKEVLHRLDNIELSQQEDVQGSLNFISKKVDSIIYEVDYLSGKTGIHDTKIYSLEKRIQS